MPKEIVLEDGTKETVYTEDEVSGYKQGSQKNKERKEALSKLQEELGVGEGEKIEDKLKELKDNANPNFAKYRKKFNALEKIAKEKGVQVDDEGNISTGDKQLTFEEIQKQIDEGVSRALSTKQKDSVLSQYKEEDRKVVEHYLDKLMATGGTLEENLAIAEAKAFPGQDISRVKLANNNLNGQAPRMTPEGGKKFTDTEEGKKLLEQLVPKKK
jgi:hypothetical protein